MTEAERARLTDEWCTVHAHEWDAYLVLPLAERMDNQDQVEAALKSGGPLAGRALALTLGMPDELCDPIEVLEARIVDSDDWLREAAAQLGLSPIEIEKTVNPTPSGQVDH